MTYRTFRLLLPEGYALYINIFKNAEKGTVFNRIWDKNVRDYSTSYFSSNPTSMGSRLAEEETAIFYTKEGLLYFDELRCDVLTPWETKYPGFLTMAFPKNSTYFPLFHFQAIRHFENGVIFALRNRWTTFRSDHCKNSGPQSLGLEKLVSLFGLLAVASTCAVAIFIMEKLAQIKGPLGLGQVKNLSMEKQWNQDGTLEQEFLMLSLNEMTNRFEISEKRRFIFEMQRIVNLSIRNSNMNSNMK